MPRTPAADRGARHREPSRPPRPPKATEHRFASTALTANLALAASADFAEQSTLNPIVQPTAPSVASRVLIVEDEVKTRESLVEGLQMESWVVAAAATGRAAIQQLETAAFDLLVLDRMLPDGDGFSVLRHLRERGIQTPVLLLSARGSLDDKVDGLELGADDYLAKPFAFAELVARCRALLRRPVLSNGQFLRCEDLQLDTRARTAMRGGEAIALTPREVDILEYLLRYQGQIVTREMLEQDVWKQTQRMTSLDNVLDVQMMRLRRKVDGETRARIIHTLRGVGYRMGKEGE